jgi:hypothetical protein
MLLLLVGFLWIMLDALQGFADYQHSRWIWQAQRLPEGRVIERDPAVAAMRQMGLALKDRHRVVVYPAFLMLGGGLAIAYGSRPKRL